MGLASGMATAGQKNVASELDVRAPHVDLAGISGGGVYRLIERVVGDSVGGSLELAGIIYFGSAGFEVVSAHDLSSLSPNGEFRA